MTRLTQEKIDEITDRHENRDAWAGKAPFYKGMFWSPEGGRKRTGHFFSKWRENGRPNLLVVRLPSFIRRSDFEQARKALPGFERQIDMLADALDNTEFTFSGDRDFFDRWPEPETVQLSDVHRHLFFMLEPASPETIEEIARAATRLHLAWERRLKGVILSRESYFRSGYGAHYSLVMGDEGYKLESKQQTVIIKDRGASVDTQDQGLEVPATPSIYAPPLDALVDPRFRHTRTKAYNDTNAAAAACVVADMVAHGETAVIIRLENGKEFVLADLDIRMSIRNIEASLRGIIENCHQIDLVRVFPNARARHRFYVVGGAVVADSSPSDSVQASHVVSMIEYLRENGPTKTALSYRADECELAAMRSFCEENLERICQVRKNWIVDLEIDGDKVYLANIEEIFDGEWFGNTAEVIMDALIKRQDEVFTDAELALRGSGFSSGPRQSMLRRGNGKIVMGEAVELEDGIAELLGGLKGSDMPSVPERG